MPEADELASGINAKLSRIISGDEPSGSSFFILSPEPCYVRFIKIRNSYTGICIRCGTLLKPLVSVEPPEGVSYFICDTGGRLLSVFKHI